MRAGAEVPATSYDVFKEKATIELAITRAKCLNRTSARMRVALLLRQLCLYPNEDWNLIWTERVIDSLGDNRDDFGIKDRLRSTQSIFLRQGLLLIIPFIEAHASEESEFNELEFLKLVLLGNEFAFDYGNATGSEMHGGREQIGSANYYAGLFNMECYPLRPLTAAKRLFVMSKFCLTHPSLTEEFKVSFRAKARVLALLIYGFCCDGAEWIPFLKTPPTIPEVIRFDSTYAATHLKSLENTKNRSKLLRNVISSLRSAPFFALEGGFLLYDSRSLLNFAFSGVANYLREPGRDVKTPLGYIIEDFVRLLFQNLDIELISHKAKNKSSTEGIIRLGDMIIGVEVKSKTMGWVDRESSAFEADKARAREYRKAVCQHICDAIHYVMDDGAFYVPLIVVDDQDCIHLGLQDYFYKAWHDDSMWSGRTIDPRGVRRACSSPLLWSTLELMDYGWLLGDPIFKGVLKDYAEDPKNSFLGFGGWARGKGLPPCLNPIFNRISGEFSSWINGAS